MVLLYQYLAFIFSITFSCSGPLFRAYLSIALNGTPPNVLAIPAKKKFFIGLSRPTLCINFWIPYLKLCCQVLYITPNLDGSIVFPISKNSDFSSSPIGTNVNGVVVDLESDCSVSIE